MKLYNCVMLTLDNPNLVAIQDYILKNLSHYIDYDYINENCKSWNGRGVETEPHVTIIYGLNPGLGKNALEHFIKMKNRVQYRGIRELGWLTNDNPLIDTFDNEARVLKINMRGCNEYDKLKDMMLKLSELPNDWQYKNEYNPHITLTYLKPDTPDEVIKEVNDKFSGLLDKFSIKDFMISSDDPEVESEVFF